METKKEFPTEAVLTIFTDTMLCEDFGIVHECYEHLFGAAIPSMLLSKDAVTSSCRNRIASQVPNIKQGCSILRQHTTVNSNNIDTIKEELHSALGKTIVLSKGCGEPDNWQQA